MGLSVYLPEYERLQVIMSYDTDHRYNFYCLPGIITKKYLNKYVFKGSANNKYLHTTELFTPLTNEFLIKSRDFNLYERQLYDLLGEIKEYGESSVFKELTYHVSDTVHAYKLVTGFSMDNSLLYNQRTNKKTSIYEEIIDTVKNENHMLSLTETVRAQTLLLLGYKA